MKIIRTIGALQRELKARRRRNETVGFVPTMGALHAGHLSLVRRARQDNDVVVVSIFVNPLQFGPREDFRQYPRTLKEDVACLKNECDVIFAPPAGEIFPPGFSSRVEVPEADHFLCGRSRPGHFTGVMTVVAKLLNIVGPDAAYFGRKDAQQAALIAKMVRDLNFPVKIVTCPIVREPDGLAMSSRNAYLSGKERRDAVVLFQALKSAERMVVRGQRNVSKIIAILGDLIIRTNSARVDYIAVVDKDTLEPLKSISGTALLCLAVWIGTTRLIDNTMLKVK